MRATEFIRRLESHTHSTARRSADGWMCRCPAHDDRNASLSVGTGSGGRILLKCHAGCQADAIVSALGLKLSDLFPDARKTPSRRQPASPEPAATYDYRDETGALLFQTCRYVPKNFKQRRPHPTQSGAGIWNLEGVRRVLYRLPELKAALAAKRTVFVAEGEKDCEALSKAGFVATGNPMGAGKWLPEQAESLRSAARVVLIADKDEPNPKTGIRPGQAHAVAVARSLRGAVKSVKLIELPDRNGHAVKDSTDWFAAGGTPDELKSLVKAAPEFAPAPVARPCKAGSVAAE